MEISKTSYVKQEIMTLTILCIKYNLAVCMFGPLSEEPWYGGSYDRCSFKNAHTRGVPVNHGLLL